MQQLAGVKLSEDQIGKVLIVTHVESVISNSKLVEFKQTSVGFLAHVGAVGITLVNHFCEVTENTTSKVIPLRSIQNVQVTSLPKRTIKKTLFKKKRQKGK